MQGITDLIKTHDVIPQVGTTCRSHNLDTTKMLAHVDTYLAHLQSQLTSWHQHYGYKINKKHFTETAYIINDGLNQWWGKGQYSIANWTLNVVFLQINPFQEGDEVGSAFPCAIFSSSENVPSWQGNGNALLLQR